MIKLLLADDEQIIRKGIRDAIDWETLDVELCAEAMDGSEALELIRYHQPEIVISDIKMPYKTGIDMMKEAKELFPDISFLFISGYDEFSYAQKALKLGAADYILKPIDPEYLNERIKEVIQVIKSKQHQQHTLASTEAIKIRQYLQNIILQREPSLIIRKNPLNMHANLINRKFCVLSLQFDQFFHLAGENHEKEISSQRREFFQLIKLFKGVEIYRISESVTSYEICLAAKSETNLEETINKGLFEIYCTTKNLYFSVTIGVGSIISGLSDLTRSYDEAQEALELKFIKGGNCAYFAKDYQEYRKAIEAGNAIPDSSTFIQAVREGDLQRLTSSFLPLKECILKSEQPKRAFHWFSTDILLQVIRILTERGYSIEEIIDDPLTQWETLENCQTINSFSELFLELLCKITTYIAKRRDFHASQILDQAITYVKEHFCESSLNLEAVAGSAGMSPCYFSVIFKQQTGKTFIRFLTDLRIEKAKDLILFTDAKSYEIGPTVGYENPSYFSTVFKKTTGMNPSEYKKRFS